MSARGSTAKISSLSSMSPPLPASRVCTLTFILAFLALGARVRGGAALGLRLVRRSGCCFILRSSGGFRLGGGTGFLLGGDGGDFGVARQRGHLVNRALVDEPGGGMILDRDRLPGLDEAGGVRRIVV